MSVPSPAAQTGYVDSEDTDHLACIPTSPSTRLGPRPVMEPPQRPVSRSRKRKAPVPLPLTQVQQHDRQGETYRPPTPFPEATASGAPAKRRRPIPQPILRSVRGQIEQLDSGAQAYLKVSREYVRDHRDKLWGELGRLRESAKGVIAVMSDDARSSIAVCDHDFRSSVEEVEATLERLHSRLQNTSKTFEERKATHEAMLQDFFEGMLANMDHWTTTLSSEWDAGVEEMDASAEQHRQSLSQDLAQLKQHFQDTEENVEWLDEVQRTM